ncbi:MAG: GNAT family N-acetyltransferase [Eubacteriales bacterium]|nr:GNAT family N-acetyltransferase [Eubacteriales bacterium]
MSIFLREATKDDADIILEWRNDPLTRNQSFSKGLIDRETHIQWFLNKLSDTNCFLFILMDGTERVGHLRIDKVNDIGEISYMIAPDKRKRGYGKKIIGLSERVVPHNINALIGLVQNTNESSKKCFISNHYSEFSAGDIICYIKVLS